MSFVLVVLFILLKINAIVRYVHEKEDAPLSKENILCSIR